MVGIYKTMGTYWRGGLYQRDGSNTNLTLQRGHLLDRRHSFESVLALHLQKST